MIRKVRGEEIPVCVEIIKKSFLTVADEYGFTEKNAPRFTAFATTQDRLYWHMDGEHRPMYVFEEDGALCGYFTRKAPGETTPIHFCYNEMENVNLIILQYCQSIDIRALEDNY